MIEPAADFNHRAGYLSVAKTHDDKRIRGSYAFKEARQHQPFGWPEQAFLHAQRVMMCLLFCQSVRACKACCPPLNPEAADMIPCQEVQLFDAAVSSTQAACLMFSCTARLLWLLCSDCPHWVDQK